MKKQNTENQKETKPDTKLVLRNTIYTEEELIARMNNHLINEPCNFDFVKNQENLFIQLHILLDCKKILNSKKNCNSTTCDYCDFYPCTQVKNGIEIDNQIFNCEDKIKRRNTESMIISETQLQAAWKYFERYKLKKKFQTIDQESLFMFIKQRNFSGFLKIKPNSKTLTKRIIADYSKILNKEWGDQTAESTFHILLEKCKNVPSITKLI